MYQSTITQTTEVLNRMPVLNTFSQAVEVQMDSTISRLLAQLSPENSWGDRKAAARKLGYLRSPEALPGLLYALMSDPFWMVRCAVIQALEFIGDSTAVPILLMVAQNDGFQVVRSHAARAVERLS